MIVAENVTEADIATHWGTKACGMCKTVRPRADFYKHTVGIMGLTTNCKRCRTILYYRRRES